MEPQNPAEAIRCHCCGSALVLHDRYGAIQLLGQGGSSRTFLAADSDRSGSAASYVIKQYRSDQIGLDPSDRLKTLGKYPLVPAVIDIFEQVDYLYLVQAYIAGDSLATLLGTQGKFNVAEIWQILETVLPIVQAAHSLQMIHGDIKPENLICVRSDQAAENGSNRLADCSLVLVDWGLDLTAAPDRPSGSPEYAAPEQIRGSAGFSSDLYSLGVTCIHLLTGIHPFSLFDVATNAWVWQNYWVRADASDRYETQALIQLLDRLIAPDLSQRFSTATEAIAALQSVRRKKITVPVASPSWECYATLIGHQGIFSSVNSMAIAPDNRVLASGSDDKTIRVWSATGEEQAILQDHSQFVKSVVFHPRDPSILASGSSDRTVKVWDRSQNQPIQTLTGHTNHVNAIAFSPNGSQIVSASADKTVRLWTLQTGDCSATLKGHTLAVQAIAYSPNGTQIASASADKTARIWDLTAQRQIQLLEGHTWAVKAIAYSPNGNWLATGSEDRTICLWDTATWQCVRVLSGHPWAIASLAFFPDSETLISGSWDKTAKFWQVNTGAEITALTGHTDSVNSVAIAIDGSFVATGSKDKTVKLWRRA
jgi:WD40 repeat protein